MMIRFSKYILAGAISLAALTGCGEGNGEPSNNDGEITLSGKVQNPVENGNILLYRMTEGPGEVVDTLNLQPDSTFSKTFSPDPGYYRINFYNRQQIAIVLDNEDLHLTVDGSNPRGIVEAEGSEDMQLLLFFQDLRQGVQQRMGGLMQQAAMANQTKDSVKLEELQSTADGIQDSVRQVVKERLEGNTDNLAAIQSFAFLDYDKDKEFINEIVSSLKEKYPDEYVVQRTADEIDRMSATMVGAEAPEISLSTPEGDTLNLSDLKGKYVLIDFWAAWCKPCRAENPNVVRMYEKYQSEDFEILGVSLDRDREKWLEAIEQDNLTWKHVSDLQYFNSQAAQDYNITAIPATVLVDPEGKIIAKNLRGPSLEAKLKELFEG